MATAVAGQVYQTAKVEAKKIKVRNIKSYLDIEKVQLDVFCRRRVHRGQCSSSLFLNYDWQRVDSR